MSSEERSLDWYKSAVLNGLRFQVKQAKSNMWPTYKAYYRHEFPDGIIPVNMVFSILRALVPQVYFRNPSAVITPTKPGLEYELHARLLEDTDNWLLRETNVKYEIKRMITDTFLCGIGGGFFGYDSLYGFDKKQDVTGQGSATLTQFNKSGNRIEYHDNVAPGMPWFLRARPEDTIYPWGCESAESAEWVAMRLFRPVVDVKADPKYKDTNDLHGTFIQQRTQPEGGLRDSIESDGTLKDHEWLELFQLHDKKTGDIVVFSMNHDKFLRKEKDPLQIEGLPIEAAIFNPDPDYIYGIPDARIIEPQLLELNEIRTQAMKHRRIDVARFLFKRGAIKPAELAKLLSEDVQVGVEVEAEAKLGDSIMALNPGASAILADMERIGDVVRGDVREMVGFSRTLTGEYMGKTHISAKETDVVSWANQIRVDERRDVVADLLTNIIRRYNQLIFTYWTQPMIRSVVGPDGAKYWIRFTPTEIKGEYNYKVDPSNAVPVDQRTKRKDAIEMAQAWANMNMGLVKSGAPAPAELQRYFFSQYDGINVDRLLAQMQPTPPQGGGMPPPGSTPGAAVPPQVAAQLMQRNMG